MSNTELSPDSLVVNARNARRQIVTRIALKHGTDVFIRLS